MFILITLAIIFLIGVTLIICCKFEYSNVPCYDPEGKDTNDFYDTYYKNMKEKDKVREELKNKYREEHNKPQDYDVRNYDVKYCKVTVTNRWKLRKRTYMDFSCYRSWIGWPTAIIMLIALVSTSIVCVCHHGPLHQEEYATKLTVSLDDLHDRQETIYLTLSGDLNFKVSDSGTYYHVLVDKPIDMMKTINNYNADVKSFKQELYLEKIRSESPWTNTFINPGFKRVEGYNDTARNYKEILGDTLKTFELKGSE